MFKIVLGGQTRGSTSAVDMKICKADPHPNPAVRWMGNKYVCLHVCMVGCKSGVSLFTATTVLFKSWA